MCWDKGGETFFGEGSWEKWKDQETMWVIRSVPGHRKEGNKTGAICLGFGFPWMMDGSHDHVDEAHREFSHFFFFFLLMTFSLPPIIFSTAHFHSSDPLYMFRIGIKSNKKKRQRGSVSSLLATFFSLFLSFSLSLTTILSPFFLTVSPSLHLVWMIPLSPLFGSISCLKVLLIS